MRRIWVWVGVIAAAVGLTVALAAVVGTTLPVGHEVTRSERVPATQAAIWDRITQPAGYPSWRSDISSVEVLPPDAGRLRWRERSGSGTMTYIVESAALPVELVARIAELDAPFGGTWTIRLAPDGAGTRVTVTERGEVYNPILRFAARYVVGHTATIDRWLADLSRSFGGTPSR